MLKPIPQEKPHQVSHSKIPRRPRAKQGIVAKMLSSKANPKQFSKLRQKLEHQMNQEKNIIHSVCIKMVNFVKKGGEHTVIEVGEMIHGLQKSILSLQRQRQRLAFKEQKNRKKK